MDHVKLLPMIQTEVDSPEVGGGDGIEGIEPCGEFAPVLDRLW